MRKFYTIFKALAKDAFDGANQVMVFKLGGVPNDNYYFHELPLHNQIISDTVLEQETEEITFKLGVYKHFKCNEYEVKGIAFNIKDTKKKYVFYRALETGKFWLREYDDFFFEFEDGSQRFEFKLEM